MKLSIVVTTRNDDHGGKLTERTNVFLYALAQQVAQVELDAEVIVVEWNPPPGRQRLVDELDWPKTLPCRVITVPAEAHNKLENSNILPLFQMIAKNVGIRRAHGEWILATNPDIIFSQELLEFIAHGEMNGECFYRASRYDMRYTLLPCVEMKELLEMCIRGTVRAQEPKTPTGIHTNACGDFTMLTASKWGELRGYAEHELWSMHIDSLLLLTADVLGMRQVLLGWPIYHFKHTGSWSVEPRYDLPMLRYKQVNAMWKAMKKAGEISTVSGPDWGMVDVDLEEVDVHAS